MSWGLGADHFIANSLMNVAVAVKKNVKNQSIISEVMDKICVYVFLTHAVVLQLLLSAVQFTSPRLYRSDN